MKKYLQAFFETTITTLIYLAIGYYFFSDDPVMLDSKAPFVAILLTIITLFHGVKHGLFSLFLLGIALYMFYQPFPINKLLAYLLLVLILGQFYHYWFKKINSIEAASLYTKNRLNEANNAFYALKISHDTLEKSYALKDVSIRSAFKELEKIHFKEGTHFQNFLYLLTKWYRIESASIAMLDGSNYKTIASNTKGKSLNLDDPLVQNTLQSAQTSYISQEEVKNSIYLSVIPVVDQEGTINALLTIDKMPFLEFNENNMIEISILFSYFLDQVKLQEHIKNSGGNAIDDDQIFAYHYDKLLSLNKNFNINSSTIVIKTDNALTAKMVEESVKKSLRSLDRYKISKEKPNIITLLLPFEPTVTAGTIIKKLKSTLTLDDGKLDYMVFKIDQKSLMQQYIKES